MIESSSNSELLNAFKADGFVALPGFIRGEELDELTANVDRFIHDIVPQLPPEHVFYEDKNDSATLKQIQKMGDHDPWFQKLYTNSRFREVAEILLAGPVVPKNLQYFNKPPGVGQPTPPHQDGFYFMLDPCEAVTMWYDLEKDITIANPGSSWRWDHRRYSNPTCIQGSKKMKYLIRNVLILVCLLIVPARRGQAEAPAQLPEWKSLFNGEDLTGWIDVNTSPETWFVKDGLLVCQGTPIGVMRSEKQYENFILHIEWRHMEPGGNSGVFVWSEGTPAPGKRLPKGMEVQMLELDWINQHLRDGKPNHIGYISGELFGANGLTGDPDNPRGSRSMSKELRCKPHGEWNVYDVVCVDGTVKLSINGKFVNGIRNASVKKGYLCLESEGAEIHFRSIRILELPPGILSEEQSAPVVKTTSRN